MPQQTRQLQLLRGDKVGSDVDYRDALPVNVSGVVRQVLGAQGYMLQEPGLSQYAIGQGKDRGGIWNERLSEHLRVSGTSLIKVDAAGNTTTIGTISGSDTVSLPYSFNTQGIVANGRFFLYDGTTLSEVTDSTLGRPIDAVWVDGYYFFTDGENIYHSNLNDETVIDALKFATSEFSPDPTLGVGLTSDNKVIVFNRYSIEYFVNDASTNFAFSRLPSRSVKFGVVGTHAKCEWGGQFLFLGGAKEQSVGVFSLGVGSPEEISSREVNKIINSYDKSELESAILEMRVIDDYPYLLVHIRDHTFLFNFKVAGLAGKDFAWSIIKSSVNSDIEYRGVHGVFEPRRGEWVYGDKWSSKIGYLDVSRGTHYGEIVECFLYTPFTYLEYMSIDELEVFVIPGYPEPDLGISGPDSSLSASPTVAGADGSDTITLTMTVMDAFSGGITGLQESQFVFLGLGSGELANFSETGSGVYTIDLTNETAESLSITCKVDGVTIGSVSVTFVGLGVLALFNTASDLATYDYVGGTFTIDGSAFSTAANLNAVTSLSATRIIATSSAGNTLRAYDFDGSTWSLTATTTVAGLGLASIAALSSTTFVVVSEGNDSIQTYSFDGAAFATVGNALSITNIDRSSACALSATRIAVADGFADFIRAYDFDGTDWALTGNSLSIAGANDLSITALSSSRIAYIGSGLDELRAYDFDGTDWTQAGNGLSITLSTAEVNRSALSAIDSSTVIFARPSNNTEYSYSFDGTDWTQFATQTLDIAAQCSLNFRQW